jgi:hypothetical protein
MQIRYECYLSWSGRSSQTTGIGGTAEFSFKFFSKWASLQSRRPRLVGEIHDPRQQNILGTYSGLLTHTPKDWIAGMHRQAYWNQTGTLNWRSHDPQSCKQAAARWHHYHDKISRTLGLDQGTMSSTEVGARMANGLLQYYKDALLTTSYN